MVDVDLWGVSGITDKPRAPIVAKAKIGRQVPIAGTVDKFRPERLDHIIFVEPKSGRVIDEFNVFGHEPKAFDAILIGATIRDCIDVGWKRFGTKGIKCRGNGVIGMDKETGQRQCAGEYDFEDQSRHLCEYARPTVGQNGKEKSPECKPILSMRLLVPQVPGLGVVQIDTGGVASSIPTLTWQLEMLERQTGGNMSGIAVRMSIRPFPDKFGHTAWSWQLTPLTGPDADKLRAGVEVFQRVESQMISGLSIPQIDDTPAEEDLYGLPPATEEGTLEAPLMSEEDEKAIVLALGDFNDALSSVPMTKAKKDMALSQANTALDKAIREDKIVGWLEWITVQTASVKAR